MGSSFTGLASGKWEIESHHSSLVCMPQHLFTKRLQCFSFTSVVVVLIIITV